MPPKRLFVASPEFESPSSHRGPKRRQLSSSLPPSSPCASSSSVLATPSTPAYAWTVPADSPTNPFGRIRRFIHGTTLPPPTSFARHIALRFQLVNHRADGREFNRDGVYRVVQVPLNYTLAHLRKLIAYIFDPATDAEIIASYNLRRVSNRLAAVISSSKDKGKARDLLMSPEPVGHLFEVQKTVEVGQHGAIKRGHTWAKSSTARDPYHYPGNDSEGSVFLDDESDDWRWVAEEDLELTKAWPKGCDLSKAIIYHHDEHTQIHITANTRKVPHRKGKGNKPFLFEAYGSVSLSNPEGTLRPGTVETTRWNRIGAYERFLKAEAEKDWSTRPLDEDSDEDEDAEGETDPNMSCATLPVFGLSSSPFLPSESSNPVTPFPAEPSLRRRVDYERRRLVQLTRENLKDTSGDEEDEVDELVNDNDDPALEEKPSDWDPFLDGDEIC